MIFNLIYIILSLIGIYISYRIYKEKKSAQMVCPLDGQCQDVLFSKYNKILGINLEYFGFLYYVILAFGFIFLNFSLIYIPNLLIILNIIIISGFLFSIYLSLVQKFILKKWCSWCLFSGLINLFFILLLFLNII